MATGPPQARGTRMISSASPGQRLLRAVAATTGGQVSRADAQRLQGVQETNLRGLAGALSGCLPGRFSLTGPLERRILFAERSAENGEWMVADLSGQPHATRTWPAWTRERVAIRDPEAWLSTATLTPDVLRRLGHPRILLAALYRDELREPAAFPDDPERAVTGVDQSHRSFDDLAEHDFQLEVAAHRHDRFEQCVHSVACLDRGSQPDLELGQQVIKA
jgi:hypothetical protein